MHQSRSTDFAIYVAQGRSVAVTPVTVKHAEASVERLRHLVVIYSVHRVMTAAHRHLVIRVADTLSTSAFDELAGLAGLRNAASRLYGHLVSSQSRLTRFGKDADLAVLALFANATHKHGSAGHNWIVGTANDRNSTAYPALGVFDVKRSPFAAFMARHGHDLWHHLTTDSLNTIFRAISGKNAQGNAHAINIAGPVSVAGGTDDLGGTHVRAIFLPGEAAITGILQVHWIRPASSPAWTSLSR